MNLLSLAQSRAGEGAADAVDAVAVILDFVKPFRTGGTWVPVVGRQNSNALNIAFSYRRFFAVANRIWGTENTDLCR
jgi:hypothetical protein